MMCKINGNRAGLRARMLPFVAALSIAGSVSSTPAYAQAGQSPEVQVLTLAAKAELIESKCNAFTLEGQFLYREMKSRVLNTFNQPLFDSIKETQSPTFAGDCAALAANDAARQTVDYFNNEGARMLALHHFLPPDSPCDFANAQPFRQRADAQWAKLSGSADPRLQPAAMQQEAAMIASQCNLTNAGERARSHLASSMAQSLGEAYRKPAGYGLEMVVTGKTPDPQTTVIAYRDPTKEFVKNGVLAGLYEGPSMERAGVLKDGRLVVMMVEGFGKADLASVLFTSGGKKYTAPAAKSLHPNFPTLFVLDKEASRAILSQKQAGASFGVSLVDKAGNATVWEEQYDYRGSKKGGGGTSYRPIRLDPTAFTAALAYSNAPPFR